MPWCYSTRVKKQKSQEIFIPVEEPIYRIISSTSLNIPEHGKLRVEPEGKGGISVSRKYQKKHLMQHNGQDTKQMPLWSYPRSLGKQTYILIFCIMLIFKTASLTICQKLINRNKWEALTQRLEFRAEGDCPSTETELWNYIVAFLF